MELFAQREEDAGCSPPRRGGPPFNCRHTGNIERGLVSGGVTIRCSESSSDPRGNTPETSGGGHTHWRHRGVIGRSTH